VPRGDHPFPLALSLDAAAEAKPVSSQAPSPPYVILLILEKKSISVDFVVIVVEVGRNKLLFV